MQLDNLAHRNVALQVSLDTLDARLLIWIIRRKTKRVELPVTKAVFQFGLQDPPEETCHYWLVAKPGLEVDFCFTDPQLNVDLFIVAELRAITAALSGPQSAALATPA